MLCMSDGYLLDDDDRVDGMDDSKGRNGVAGFVTLPSEKQFSPVPNC